MKRYILFAYAKHYPSGARDDEVGRYKTIYECMEAFKSLNFFEFYDILDLKTGNWVDIDEPINIDLDGNKRLR